MLLAVDIGNTNITFGLFEGRELIGQYRLVSDVKKNHESYGIDIVELLINDNIDCLKISDIVIASVVPKLTAIIKSALAHFHQDEIKVIGECGLNVDIEIDLKNKEEVGVDRLLNTIAAYKKFGGDLIIVDFGTATTFDVVGAKGAYLGGVIAPGVNLSIKALHDAAPILPNITVKNQENVIGKSTKEAMNSGIYFGYIGLIEGLLKRIKAEYGSEMKVVATGGLSSLFNDGVEEIEFVELGLTLEGIRVVFEDV